MMPAAAPCVVLALLGLGLWSSAAQKEPETTGKAAYERVCLVCHGPDARGDAAPGLLPFVMEYEELLARVREGGGEMPPFTARRISDEEVRRVGEYLELLTASAGPAPKAAGSRSTGRRTDDALPGGGALKGRP